MVFVEFKVTTDVWITITFWDVTSGLELKFTFLNEMRHLKQ
jgi:hypothetical protein